MPTLTKKVFLSSTLIDLKEYREAAVHACQRVGLLPIYMEDFPPDPRDAISFCMAKVNEADLFLGVYAHRYGFVPKGTTVSITEMEYDRAVEKGLPVHLFVMDPDYPWPATRVDKGRDYKRLESFKAKIGKQHVWKAFGELAKFKEDVLLLLHELVLKEAQAPPAEVEECRTSKRTLPSPPEMHSVPRYILTNRFIGRRRELEELDGWARTADPMLVIEAIGGMGKSALTWEWARERAHSAIQGLAGVLWWSFYEGGASMSSFVRETLAYVTMEDPEALRSVPVAEQAQQLLTELQSHPFLLVLDGFERLLTAYHHHDPSKLRDDHVNSDSRACTNSLTEEILRQLTSCAPSKILVTTRLMPSALENKARQPIRGVHYRELNGLTPEDGEGLLRDFGVNGDSSAIRRFLQQFDNHSLLISILAGRILDYRPAPGNFNFWVADPIAGGSLRLSEIELRQRRTHILAYAFEGLEPQRRKLLSRIAVLSDAADFATVAALNPYLPPRPNEVPEFDEYLEFKLYFLGQQLEQCEGEDECSRIEEEKKWLEQQKEAYQAYRDALQAYFGSTEYRSAVSALDASLRDLEERALLQWDRFSNTYDLHPIVRGHAFDQLEEPDRVQAYERIRDHFATLPPENAKEATELLEIKNTIQIYRALVGAGRFDQAVSLYKSRLSATLIFSIAAYSSVLELLAPLFREGFGCVPTIVSVYDQSYLLCDVGIALDELGRGEEALKVRLLELRLDLDAQSWFRVAVTLDNYSNGLANLNRLSTSFRVRELSRKLSIASRDEESVTVCLLGDVSAAVARGRWDEAEAAYRDSAARPIPRQTIYRIGSAEAALCWLKFHKGTLARSELETSLSVAAEAKNPSAQRHLHVLEAELALQEKDFTTAAQAAELALAIARKGGAPDRRAQGCLARVMSIQGRLEDARSLIEETEVHLVDAAEVYYHVGDSEKAKEFVLRAYEWAWADGPPHVWWWDLNRSRRLLDQLGVPEPSLPPFDPSEEKLIPCEDEIRAAIEKLTQKKERGWQRALLRPVK